MRDERELRLRPSTKTSVIVIASSLLLCLQITYYATLFDQVRGVLQGSFLQVRCRRVVLVADNINNGDNCVSNEKDIHHVASSHTCRTREEGGPIVSTNRKIGSARSITVC